MGEWFLSRRGQHDSSQARSAWAGVWTSREQNSRHDQELGLLGVERDSPGPTGHENLAQGLPWVFFV